MNLVNKSRKAFTATVVAATIAWSMGLSGLTAVAAIPPSGSLIKASLSTVYYLGADNKRYVFPNQNAYMTWYANFGSVQTITDAELASLPLGGNVTYRPGVKMVKITTDPKVYAVSKGGVLRWVTSQSVAQSLYGVNWNQQIDDVADSFFTNYTIGADINSTADYVPATETANSGSINVDKNLTAGGPYVSGTLSATLSASQPAGGTIPGSATGVAMVKVDVKNMGGAAAPVDSLTIRRTGVGSAGDFSSVYVYEGNSRLTTGRTISTSTNEATFSGLNLSLAAGETKTLWISADMCEVVLDSLLCNTVSGDENAMQVVSITSGSASASGLPVTGPTYKLAGSDVGLVTIDNSSASLSAVNAGAISAKVADFRLSAGSSEDVVFSRIALTYSGTATSTDVTNLVLKQAGTTLASTPSITSKDLAVFSLSSPVTLAKGTNRVYEVYADVAGGVRATENVAFYLDQASDLSAVGATYGYGSAVDNQWTAAVTVSVQAGQLTATFNGPAAKNIPDNSTEVELFNYTLAGQSNLEVRETKFAVAATDITDIDNFKVVDAATGALVMGPVDLTATPVTFTEVYNLVSGQARTFKVLADIASDAASTDTIRVTLGVTNLFSANKVRNLDNSTYVETTEMVPSGVITGNQHTVQEATLTTTLSSTPVSQTFIQGSQGVSLFGINLKAGDAAPIAVDTIVLTGYVDSDSATDVDFVKGQDFDDIDGDTLAGAGETATVSEIVLTAGLWNGSTQVGTTKSPTTGTGGVLTFDNLNLVVPAGQTVSLLLKGNMAANVGSVSSTSSDRVKFDFATGPDDGVTATDADGNTVTDSTTAAINNTTNDLGTRMTVASAGTISVAKAADDSESEAGAVVGGGSNVVLAKYKLSASSEELKLVKVRLTTSYAAGVSSLSLYDGATLVGGPVGVDGSGNADFTGLNFVVAKDGNKVLTVKANLNTVGTGAASSGQNVLVTMVATAGTFEVRGTSSGSSTLIDKFDDEDGDTTPEYADDIAANVKLVRKSKPTVSLSTLPSSTITATGEITVMRFTVSADAAGDVALKSVSGTLSSSSSVAYTLTAPHLRRVGDGSNLGDTSGVTGTCNAVGNTCVLNVMLTNEDVIPAGTSRTYDLRVNLAGTLSTGDSISTYLAGDTATETGSITGAAGVVSVSDGGATAYKFVWSDLSAGATHLDTVGSSSSDWTSSQYVKVLSTDAQTMTK